MSSGCHHGGCLAETPWLIPAPLGVAVACLVCVAMVAGVLFGVTRRVIAPPQKAKARELRVFYVDNCRFVLETLVICGHVMLLLCHKPTPRWRRGILGWLHSFFLQFFALCSGLLSKGYLTPERAKRSVVRVLAPFMLMNIVIPVVKRHWTKLAHIYNPYDAMGTTWFLQAWLVWRGVTPFLSTLKPGLMVLASFAICLASGYWYSTPGKYFHADIAFAFLPFYIAGYLVPLEVLSVFDRPWIKVTGLFVSVTYFTLHMWLALHSAAPDDGDDYWHEFHAGKDEANAEGRFDYGFHWDAWSVAAGRHYYFHSSHVVSEDPATYYLAWTQRLSYQVLLTWPTGLAMLAMVPHQETFFTEWGSRTMYPFMWQLPAIWCLEYLLEWLRGYSHLPAMNPFLEILLVSCCALALNVFWASRLTHSWARFIMEPTWLLGAFRDDEDLKSLYIPVATMPAEQSDIAVPLRSLDYTGGHTSHGLEAASDSSTSDETEGADSDTFRWFFSCRA